MVSPEDAYELYEILYLIVESGDLTPVEQAYQHLDDEGVEDYGPRLRFYIAAVMKHQMSRYDVFGDSLNGSLIHPVEVTASHEDVLRSWVFDVNDDRDVDISPAFPTHENWSLLNRHDLFGGVSTGAYFYATFSYGDDDQDASADDARIKALVSVLSGEPLSVEMLRREYVNRLLDEEGESFPSFVVVSQFAQLCALADAGLLRAEDTELNGALTKPPKYEPWQSMNEHTTRARTDGGSIAAARAQKLDRFVEETEALTNPERRGSFLLGVLVGQVGGYQQTAEGRSTTVVDQYSIKSMTKTRLKRVTEEVLDRNIVYSRENRMRSTMYAEVVDRLVETFAERDPDAWQIGTDDLRFYYALGVAYGLNNWTKNDETQSEDGD